MSYPTDPEFQTIDVKLNYQNVKSQTRSGRTQVRNIGTGFWTFTAKYNNLTRDELAPIYAFLAATKGGTDTFTIVPPVISNTRGDASSTWTVNGAHTAGDRTIDVIVGAGGLKAGDFIKFDNHNKVYMVTADISASGTMSIEPGLVSSLSNGEQITYSSVPFTMRVTRDVQQFKLSGYDRYQFEIDFIEAV